jgi:iron complex transport system ATP-binding protein
MKIQASDLSVVINGKHLLKTICMSLQAGELVAAIGPNGAGKSTLMKALSGEVAASSGIVTLDSTPIAQYPLSELACVLAVLPQQSDLHFPFSVSQVIGFGRIPHQSGRQNDRLIVEEIMALLQITELADRDYTTLSGGEKQRVQFARILSQNEGALDGAFLFLDEPTSSLDLSHQRTVLNIARQKSRQGQGVFLVLHDMNLAARYADRILLMKAGTIVKQGSPVDVLTEASLSELFEVNIKVMEHPQGQYPLIINW